MDRPRGCHTEWRKLTEKGKYHLTSLVSTRKGNVTNELTKQKETYRHREQTYGCQGGGWGEGIVREFGMGIYTLIYFKWITSKDLLYNTQNSAQCFVPPCREVGLRKNGYMCMYAWAPSLFTWNYHSIVNQLYPNIKFKKKEKKNSFSWPHVSTSECG